MLDVQTGVLMDIGDAQQAPGQGDATWGARPLHRESILVSAGRGLGRPGDPLNVPIVLASNFRAAPASSGAGREYSRDDATDAWEALETALGVLDGGHGVSFSSGMAAATAVLDLMPAGAVIVAPKYCYAGVLGALADGQAAGRWHVVLVDIADSESVIAALDNADLLWIETPTNPMLEVADLPVLIDAARARGVTVAVDNTFATALRQRPLELGADIVVHSATKFIGGHSDLLLGAVITADPELRDRLRRRREVGGATPGAMEVFLALRGLRTMDMRLARAEQNAGEIAQGLVTLSQVVRVRYPGLTNDPGHDRACKQMSGFGAVLSFDLADADTADAVCANVRLIVSATSLGAVESTIERRAKLPGQEHVPPGLVRLSVGCEHLDDLWADLSTAIRLAVTDR
ncbi:PLP-dependent aspartate aminotransferase family protein [Mycobacterium sp. 050128]|uniref:trans-sulfuration enzyme family protein n=1 Tax=Mycobacterium sp. 050128 TaxID=3096112 RepID=UPI002ED884BF